MNQDYKRNASLADTFLYMPFNIENLKIEISVLIKNYRFLRKSFLQKIFGEKFLEEDNYQLINKVKKFILDNLDNESLKISHIASETGMSRTKFFIKWKFLTGEAPIEFMTRIRMEKARELLESGKYRIQEIPEMVGLKDVKNFRNKYKKHFGIAPSETLRNI
ncbi:AraC family transcriptional regulator [Bacteroides xylanisolvens]|nr:AraC family transcriptional regulator [Bacteroides xylanisolvens]MDB0691913.1 AraC family transcriptional regulator [Bacteroides xylanisolvens]